MRIKTSIIDFNLDFENKCLIGKISNPKFDLAGAKIEANGFPLLEGYVVELFSVTELKQVESRFKNVDFEIGDWFVRINIYSGWEYFENNEISKFFISERINLKDFNFDGIKLDSDSFLINLKNMSGRFFSNFYLDIRGGETSGAGRNEHGPAHFHIIENGTKKDLGKVYFPSLEEFISKQKKELEFDINCMVARKDQKKISKWVFDSELKNLKLINKEWELRNEFNNRT